MVEQRNRLTVADDEEGTGFPAAAGPQRAVGQPLRLPRGSPLCASHRAPLGALATLHLAAAAVDLFAGFAASVLVVAAAAARVLSPLTRLPAPALIVANSLHSQPFRQTDFFCDQ